MGTTEEIFQAMEKNILELEELKRENKFLKEALDASIKDTAELDKIIRELKGILKSLDILKSLENE